MHFITTSPPAIPFSISIPTSFLLSFLFAHLHYHCIRIMKEFIGEGYLLLMRVME